MKAESQNIQSEMLKKLKKDKIEKEKIISLQEEKIVNLEKEKEYQRYKLESLETEVLQLRGIKEDYDANVKDMMKVNQQIQELEKEMSIHQNLEEEKYEYHYIYNFIIIILNSADLVQRYNHLNEEYTNMKANVYRLFIFVSFL